MFWDNHNEIQLNIIQPLQIMFETPIPKVGNP